MKASITQVGTVVISTQGHEKGRLYAVTQVLDDTNVYVADGKYRPLEKPKKKRTKHLQSIPVVIDFSIAGESGGLFDNSDLRKKLQAQHKEYFSVLSTKKEECALVQE